MKILITGICGFVGSTLAKAIRETHPDWDLVGIDNFCRILRVSGDLTSK